MSFIIIYVTHENLIQAKKITDYLLDSKLIACANFIPIESCYWFNGIKENSNEIVSILKTKSKNWEILKKEIEKIHPYEIPCIMKIDVEANSSYENWIQSETR